MSNLYAPGIKWEAKQGNMVVCIVRELSPWRGERQFEVINLKNRRPFSIGIGGLSRKYTPVVGSIPPEAAHG